MDKSEKKYGINENEKVKDFHRSRRMFCIYQDRLRIAEPGLPYSHAAWFKKEGWMAAGDDGLMGEIVRGIIDGKGDVYFYVGYDFAVNDDIETIFFAHLKELAQKAYLDPDALVFGGLTKSEPGTIWPPIRRFGRVKDNIR